MEVKIPTSNNVDNTFNQIKKAVDQLLVNPRVVGPAARLKEVTAVPIVVVDAREYSAMTHQYELNGKISQLIQVLDKLRELDGGVWVQEGLKQQANDRVENMARTIREQTDQPPNDYYDNK
jgi:hypothetical protein